MAIANSQPHESALYYEFSHLYDVFFGRVFYPRIVRVIRSLGIEPGARVLELGVGTGLSLEAYPQHCQVTGIDLAPEMLERAQDRVNGNGWRHVTLQQGDAQNLTFADDAFDYVMAFHVVSVVPDPQRMMAEAQRVCRPGGLLTIINHFRSRQPDGGARAARHRPGHATARLDHHALPAPAPRRVQAARGAAVEDVAPLAVHDRGGAERQGAAGKRRRRTRASRSVTEALGRRDRNQAAPHQQIGLALAPRV